MGFTLNPKRDTPQDPLFRLALWLQTPCGSHVLWAFNYAHLDFLEGYVAASLEAGQKPIQEGA